MMPRALGRLLRVAKDGPGRVGTRSDADGPATALRGVTRYRETQAASRARRVGTAVEGRKDAAALARRYPGARVDHLDPALFSLLRQPQGHLSSGRRIAHGVVERGLDD